MTAFGTRSCHGRMRRHIRWWRKPTLTRSKALCGMPAVPGDEAAAGLGC